MTLSILVICALYILLNFDFFHLTFIFFPFNSSSVPSSVNLLSPTKNFASNSEVFISFPKISPDFISLPISTTLSVAVPVKGLYIQ